jgi:1,2-dihydroxy-3-keto-5-methylthiopentene dioxygenase
MASATLYSKAASYYHWAVAVPLLSSVACVLKAQSIPKEQKQEKMDWMWRHKSLGCLTGMIVLPRVGYRLFNMTKYKIRDLPGEGTVTPILSKVGHLGLYGFMTMMPISGIAMGMYGGKGVPFFWTTIPGFEQKNGKLAGQVRIILCQLD